MIEAPEQVADADVWLRVVEALEAYWESPEGLARRERQAATGNQQ